MIGLLFLISVFHLIKCEENVTKICNYNSIDAVIDSGYKYSIIINDLIADYNQISKSFENIQILDNYETRYQAMFVTYSNDNDRCNANLSDECLTTDKSIITSTAYNIRNGDQYHMSMTYNLFLTAIVKKKKMITFNKLEIIDENESNEYIPKFIGYKHQKFKPSTYWPKHDLSIFIFNSNNTLFNSRKAIIVTKTTKQTKWEYNFIFGSEDLLYITLFWWRFDDQVYGVIQRKNNGIQYVYRFNHKNLGTPFEATNQNVMQFFNCPPKPSRHKPIIILIIIIAVIVIITFAILITTYFCLKKSKGYDNTNSSANMNSDITSTFTTTDSILTIDSDSGQPLEHNK